MSAESMMRGLPPECIAAILRSDPDRTGFLTDYYVRVGRRRVTVAGYNNAFSGEWTLTFVEGTTQFQRLFHLPFGRAHNYDGKCLRKTLLIFHANIQLWLDAVGICVVPCYSPHDSSKKPARQ